LKLAGWMDGWMDGGTTAGDMSSLHKVAIFSFKYIST
jgi:hypothetical protein